MISPKAHLCISYRACISKYFAINREILNFFSHLQAYSRYWSPFASVYYVAHTFYIVYLLYPLLLHHSTFDLQQRSFFVLFSVEFAILMLIVTHQCTVIVRNNVHIYKANRQFCYVKVPKNCSDLRSLIKVC